MEEDQEKILEGAKRAVKEHAYYMRNAIEEANLRSALKHASNMLGELRTEFLSPKNYYILFMQVFDELRDLEAHFREEYRRGRNLKDLYENVQHAGYVLPRIYLLTTVGSVYIGSMEVPAKYILNDLLEMIRGIQHPIKGLFIRYYFLKVIKDKLPDTGSQYEGEGGDVRDAIRTILSNLAEMNKLWIKMHTQGGKDKSKKQKERNDVKVTIGENFARLSALNGCSLEVYQNLIFEFLMDTITSTKDSVSQQYLMDCIIQVFPDEFHLNTLERLLQTIGIIMQNEVDVKTMLIRLMDRLSEFSKSHDNADSITHNIDVFSMFKNNIDKLLQDQANQVELSKLLELQVAFLKFVISTYPKEISHVNEILESCCRLCSKKISTAVSDETQQSIVKLLTIPLESLSMKVLALNEFPNLMRYLPLSRRKIVAVNIARAVANSGHILGDMSTVTGLIEFLKPMLYDESSNGESADPETIQNEQTYLARIVHLVLNDDPNENFTMLEAFKEELLQGGNARIVHTVPSLVYAYLKLSRYVHQCYQHAQSEAEQQEAEGDLPTNSETKVFNRKPKFFKGEIKISHKDLFLTVRNLIQRIIFLNAPICLRLNLSLVLAINEVSIEKEYDEFAYEICSDALQIYEDDVADADAKMMALTEISACFQRLHCLSAENYDVLVANTTQYCAKLLKKSDQCLGVLKCTHLFYSDAWKNEQKVMECFHKVLKLAEVVNNAQLSNNHLKLYVSILNKFIYFAEKEGFSSIRGEDVGRIVNIIHDKSAALQSEPDAQSLQVYFKNTLKMINQKKESNPHLNQLLSS